MSLYNSQHLGKSEFYFWYGQVVGGIEWEDNHQHVLSNRDDAKGWGYRCKVAIMGSDPRIVTDGVATNSECRMAEVMLPTTGGGGIGGPYVTPSIGNNSFVIGFYKDGVDATDPIIIGVLPNIRESELTPYVDTEKVRYIAASGVDSSKDELSTGQILVNPSSTDVTNQDGTGPHTFVVKHTDQAIEPSLDVFQIPVSFRCVEEGGELKGIQAVLQTAMKYIAFLSRQSSIFAASVSDLRRSIDNVIETAARYVTAYVKEQVAKIRELTLNLFEKQVQFLIDLTPANLRAQVVDGVEAETDILSCIFNRIIAGLLGLVTGIVEELLQRAVSAAACTAENVVGKILANILGTITEGLDAAIGGVTALVGGVVDFSGQILDALGFIFGILNILTCQEEYACPNVEQWNMWYGQEDGSDPVNKEINKVLKTLANNAEGDTSSCSEGPILSGPPIIKVKGGGNNNNDFSGNAIVSGSGEIIGVDIINPGSGYTKPPILIVEDKGGNGSGAVLRPVMNDNGGVEDVIVIDSGVGYLPRANGSTGIGGLRYSNPEETIIFNENTGYNNYPPNANVDVFSGDLMYLPSGSTGVIYNTEGDQIQSSLGLGPTEPITVIESGILNTPNVTFEEIISRYPTKSDNTYPIVLEIKDTFIKNTGFNYSDEDTIIIEPSNGAQLNPNYGSFGVLESVDIINPGIGFTEIPRIYIQSDTGYNAIIIPIFAVRSVGDLNEEENENLIASESVIDIVDCVGIVPPNVTFDLVPR